MSSFKGERTLLSGDEVWVAGAGERLVVLERPRAGGADGSRERLRPPDGAGEWCLDLLMAGSVTVELREVGEWFERENAGFI